MAIDDLLDEHEQSRRVQEWLRRNGAGLVGGILLGLGAVGAWTWWQQRQVEDSMREADAYQAALDAVEARGAEAADVVAALPEGPYRTLASLELARAQVAGGQGAAAIVTLQKAAPLEPELEPVVDVRVARLLLDAGKPADALKAVEGDGLAANELRGDAYLAMDQRDKAREAYGKALALAEVGAPERNVLELKYTQVGGVVAAPQTP